MSHDACGVGFIADLRRRSRDTGSRLVRAILRTDRHLSSFHRVVPVVATAVDQDRAVNE